MAEPETMGGATPRRAPAGRVSATAVSCLTAHAPIDATYVRARRGCTLSAVRPTIPPATAESVLLAVPSSPVCGAYRWQLARSLAPTAIPSRTSILTATCVSALMGKHERHASAPADPESGAAAPDSDDQITGRWRGGSH